jgi:alpha-L-rhamnosidase
VQQSCLAIAGWCEPTPTTSESRHPVSIFPDYEGILQIKRNEPPRIVEELASVSITPHGEGAWIADFGQNLVGFCRLKMQTTRSGQEITLRFAEMLQEDGSLYTQNLRTARATDRYFCKGAPEEVWQPRFTFHGFHYVEITGTDTAPNGATTMWERWNSYSKEHGFSSADPVDMNLSF